MLTIRLNVHVSLIRDAVFVLIPDLCLVCGLGKELIVCVALKLLRTGYGNMLLCNLQVGNRKCMR